MSSYSAPNAHYPTTTITTASYPHDALQNQILRSRTMEELAYEILNHKQNCGFSECSISTAVNKFWKFRQDRERENKRRGPLFPHEVEALKRLFDAAKGRNFQSRQASTIVKAIGNGGFYHEVPQGVDVVKHIINTANFQTYRPLEISHCVEAVTALKLMDQGLFFRNVHDCLARRSLRDFNPVDISGILYGFALCGSSGANSRKKYEHEEVFEMFAKELDSRDYSVGGEADTGKFELALSRISLILTSFALVNYKPANTMVKKLVAVANRKLRDIKVLRCPEVANLLWSLVVLGDAQELELGRELEYRNLKYFNTQQIASMAWSCALAPNYATERFYSNVCVELKDRKFHDLDLHTFVVLCWSLARIRHPSSLAVFGLLANELLQRRRWESAFTKQQLVVLAWAFHEAARISPSASATILALPAQIQMRLKEIGLSGADNDGEEVSAAAGLTGKELVVLARCSGRSDDLFLTLVEQLEEGERGYADEEWIDIVYFGVNELHNGEWLQSRLRLVDIAELQRANHLARYCSIIGRAGLNSMQNEFQQIAQRVVLMRENWSLSNLAVLLVAFTELQFYHGEMFAAVLKRAVKLVSKSGIIVDDVVSICWAMLANGVMSSDLVKLLAIQPAAKPNNSVMVWECAEAWKQRFPQAELPPLLLNVEESKPVEEDVTVQVAEVLREKLDFTSTKREDANVVRVSSNVVAIVWGNKPFTYTTEYLEDGATVRGSLDFIQRLWGGRGFWTLLVNAHAWKKMGENLDLKSAYLEAKLEALQQQ